MSRRALHAIALVALVLLSGSAHADESDALRPTRVLPPRTVDVSAELTTKRSDVRWFWSNGAQTVDSGSTSGVDVRAHYWVLPGLLVHVELGRPEVDDRLGHSEDWYTDRARVLASYELRQTVGDATVVARATAGLSVPTEELTAVPSVVGVGGSASASLILDWFEAFAFATAGRPGITGAHGHVGAGLREESSWGGSLAASGWTGYTLDHGSVEAHSLQGFEVTGALTLAGRWSIYATVSLLRAPRSYVLRADVLGKPSMQSVSVGLQVRFDGPAPHDAAPVFEDPWDPASSADL